MARTDVVVSEPMLIPLPTVEGCVHGIVGVKPTRVQCGDCLRVFSSESTLFAVKAVLFNPRQPETYLRCCEPCWEARGWFEGYYGKEYRGDS